MISNTGDMINVVSTVAVPRITANMILKKAVKNLFMSRKGV